MLRAHAVYCASQHAPERVDAFPEPSAGDWCVLHTKSRQEKVVSDALAAVGAAHFLPLVRHVRYYGKRKALVEMPLFPGYVFLRGSKMLAYEANQTQRIARVIDVFDQAQLDWELRNLSLALGAAAELDPYPYLVAGAKVEVRAGPFRGLQGVVDSRMKQNRLLLQVKMLGRAVSVEIDGALLDPINESALN
jgi:transcription antitermination factor NusG